MSIKKENTPTEVLIKTLEEVDDIDTIIIVFQNSQGITMRCNDGITLQQMSYLTDAAKHTVYSVAFETVGD